MLEKILASFASKWQGPAILARVGNKTMQLGQGDVKAEVRVRNPKLLPRLLRSTSLAFGEAYMRGDITIEGDLLAVLEGYYKSSKALERRWIVQLMKHLRLWLPPRFDERRSINNASHHYDIGNDFYKLWLDSTLTYTCAYYASPEDTLEAAQQRKLELICRKIRLMPGQRVLDLGCGWGSFLFYAATHYGAEATGVVAAKEQAAYIEAEAKKRGLADKVKVITGDWREAKGQYDRVVSIGMFEHIGRRQHEEFFALHRRLLAADGIAFIHTIGRMAPALADKWIGKYIFPGAYPTALEQIAATASRHDFHIVDIENLYMHYVYTLRHWSANFARVRAQVVGMYDEQFARMWWLYLQGSEAAFRWGGLQLWQIVLLPNKDVPWPLNREVAANSLR